MKKRSESAQEKRDTILASARFKKAYDKAKAETNRTECAHGHEITPENTHIGDLLRTGKITCDPCNRIAQTRYHEGNGPKQPKAKKAHAPRKQSPKPTPVESPAPAPVATAPAPVVDRAAEITALMEKFGLSRKSAAQRYDRAAKKAAKHGA